eukprot:CFRG3168T1
MDTQKLIQRLADTAGAVFKLATGTPAHESGVLAMRNIMKDITASGLNSRPMANRPPVAYGSVVSHRNYTIGIFYLKKGEIIPLHDHPEMTVLSKVLYGRLRVRSMDWVQERNNELLLESKIRNRFNPRLRVAQAGSEFVIDGDTEEDPESTVGVLRPLAGNIHELFALTDTAFLDVLGPPYKEGLRDCHYYKALTHDQVLQSLQLSSGSNKVYTKHTYKLDNASLDSLDTEPDKYRNTETQMQENNNSSNYMYLAEVEDTGFSCQWTAYTGPCPLVD